jgi:hypothetical protein
MMARRAKKMREGDHVQAVIRKRSGEPDDDDSPLMATHCGAIPFQSERP